MGDADGLMVGVIDGIDEGEVVGDAEGSSDGCSECILSSVPDAEIRNMLAWSKESETLSVFPTAIVAGLWEGRLDAQDRSNEGSMVAKSPSSSRPAS